MCKHCFYKRVWWQFIFPSFQFIDYTFVRGNIAAYPSPLQLVWFFYYDFNVLWSISPRKSVSNKPSIEVIVLQNYFIQKTLRWIGTQVHPLILGKVKYIWILFRVANTMVTWAPSQYKDHLSRYGDSHSKYERVIRPSYPPFLYNGQPYTRKTISLYSDDPGVLAPVARVLT